MMRRDSPAVTDLVRLELSFGACDALRATHFRHRFPPHFHESFAIGVVESGMTMLRTMRGTWVARPGTILAFSAGEVHAADPVGSEGFSYRMIYPSGELFREAGIPLPASERPAPVFSQPVIEDHELGEELRLAHRPLMDRGASPGSEARLVRALRTLTARHGARQAPERGEPRALGIVEAAQAQLESRFAERVRIADLAELCGVGAFHLIRVFHRLVGVPPYAYLLQVRVNRARVLLLQGVPVSDVAYRCGFSDQSHLTRTFKRAIGVPPGQYLRAVQAGRTTALAN